MSYRAAVNARAGVNTANTVYYQLRNTSTTRHIYVVGFELSMTVASTNAQQFLLSRSTATGTATTTVAGQAADPNNVASLFTLDSAWSSAPTFTTGGPHLWAQTLPVTAGTQYVWYAPSDQHRLVIPASGGIVLATANGAGTTLGSTSLTVFTEE